MCLTVVVAGSVWSIITGVRIYQKSQQVYGTDYASVKTNNTTTTTTNTNSNSGTRLLDEDKKNI